MGSLSYVGFIFSIILILILLKQYLVMWIALDRFGLRILKYILPLLEVTSLIFMDQIFLFPSTLMFLFLIYKGKIVEDEFMREYYSIERDKFYLKPKLLLTIIILAPGLFFIIRLLNNKITDIFSLINIQLIPSLSYGANNNKQLIDYLVLFGVTCIIAPIVEEFAFRVLIYRNWLARFFKKRIFALLVSSLFFSFSHFDISTMIYTFMTGIILGFIYDGFGYLGGVLLHMMFNSYGFIEILQGTIEISTIIYLNLMLGIIVIFFSATKNKPIIKRV